MKKRIYKNILASAMAASMLVGQSAVPTFAEETETVTEKMVTEIANEKQTADKPRTIITQDAEVDDKDSLLHVLLYSNEIEIQGIVQTSSKFHWIGVEGKETPTKTDEDGNEVADANGSFDAPYRWPGTEWMQTYLDAYAEVYPNLSVQDSAYPTPEHLREITKVGNIGYEGEMDSATEGSDLIKDIILDDDERTLYLQAWGGTNTIARALQDIEAEYKDTEDWDSLHEKISNKIVITACGEQDNTYKTYIAEEWPQIKFMCCTQMSSYAYGWGTMPEDDSKATLKADFMTKNLINDHGALLDNYVTWADGTYLEGEEEGSQFGSNEALLENWWGTEWCGNHVKYDFLSEGDSPTFFLLLDSGLRTLEDASYGGYSGRYALDTTQQNNKGEQLNYWQAAADTYVAEDGTTSDIESSWKYIDDIQNDFAARADWCIIDNYEDANHAPEISIKEGTDISAASGETVTLTAETSDPDEDKVSVAWNVYSEASTCELAKDIVLDGADTGTVTFTVPENAESGSTIHVIAMAKDDGEHTLTHYQQVIITVK